MCRNGNASLPVPSSALRAGGSAACAMRAPQGPGVVLPRSAVTRSCLLKLCARRPLKPGEGGYTQLMAVEASLSDARRALARAARIPSAFSAEVRSLLLVVADIDRRVMLEVTG